MLKIFLSDFSPGILSVRKYNLRDGLEILCKIFICSKHTYKCTIHEIFMMLIFLASCRMTPCIFLRWPTVSSKAVKVVEQNLHFQTSGLGLVLSRFSPATLVLFVTLKLFSVSGSSTGGGDWPCFFIYAGDWRRSWWRSKTCSTATFSRENNLLHNRHCFPFPSDFRRFFFTWTLVIIGLSSLPRVLPRRQTSF